MKDNLILSTNELENAIDYLEKAAQYYNVRKDSHWFKWLMISLHGALYGFGVCAVKGTSPNLRVLENPSKKQLVKVLSLLSERHLGINEPLSMDHEEILADEHLLSTIRLFSENNLNSIWTILSKCEDPIYMNQFTHSKVLKKTPKQDIAIERMISYRNDFAHYKPKSSGITESELWIVSEVVEVIRFLAIESGNIFYFKHENFEKVKQLLSRFE